MKVTIFPNNSFDGILKYTIYNENYDTTNLAHGTVQHGKSKVLNFNISATDKKQVFVKGHIYYFEFTPSSNATDGGSFIFYLTGDYQTTGSDDDSKNSKKEITLTVTIQKGSDVIKISTLEKASITFSMNKKIIYKGKKKVKKVTKSSKNGTIKIKLSRKLKTKDEIKITVKKSGYVTKNYCLTI